MTEEQTKVEDGSHFQHVQELLGSLISFNSQPQQKHANNSALFSALTFFFSGVENLFDLVDVCLSCIHPVVVQFTTLLTTGAVWLWAHMKTCTHYSWTSLLSLGTTSIEKSTSFAHYTYFQTKETIEDISYIVFTSDSRISLVLICLVAAVVLFSLYRWTANFGKTQSTGYRYIKSQKQESLKHRQQQLPGVCSNKKSSRLRFRSVSRYFIGALILALCLSVPWEFIRMYQRQVAKKAATTTQVWYPNTGSSNSHT